MPVAVAELCQPDVALPVSPVDGQLCFARTVVDAQKWVAVAELEEDKIGGIADDEPVHRSVVQDQTGVAVRHQLQAGVAVLTLRKRGVPSPAGEASKAVMRLLASRSIKLDGANASERQKRKSNGINSQKNTLK